jgi:hypothetical protein
MRYMKNDAGDPSKDARLNGTGPLELVHATATHHWLRHCRRAGWDSFDGSGTC